MFKKILIANRGEIASRIIRACKELDIPSVAIYSMEDRNSLFVKKADEAYLIGNGPLDGYLNIQQIVDLAIKVGADAIHPGYGFLSENPLLAETCEKRGIKFIGPKSEVIRTLGDKIQARKAAQEVGIPVVPGTDKPLETVEEAKEFASKYGYPVIIKAAAGGGGRGMRVVYKEEEIEESYNMAKSESSKAFNDDRVFIEKFVENPHHIEFQILADQYGNVIHLLERDCSIQRRNQKIIEIAPSLILTNSQREEMGKKSKDLASFVGYENTGTIEYLVDKDMNYYFMEMNTRIQVEHPVTEVVTGVDLIQQQIMVAAGVPLPIKQEDISSRGYAIEIRINAEDPKNNFMPSIGQITKYYSPGGIGVRIDGTVYSGFKMSPYYDSMISKLIVCAPTWGEAVARAKRALKEYTVTGVKTNIPFTQNIVKHPIFKTGNFDTSFIEKHPELMDYTEYRDPVETVLAIAAAIAAYEGI